MRPTRFLVALTIGATLLLSACGGSDSSDTDKSAGAAATTEAKPAVKDLLAKAKTAFTDAPMARVKGSAVDGSDKMMIDVTNDLKGNGMGSVSQGADKGTANIIVIGKTLWVSADKTFWAANGAGAAGDKLVGKWVETSDGSGREQFGEFLDRQSLIGEILEEDPGVAEVTAGADGTTWQITDSTGGVFTLDKASGRPLSLKGKALNESVDLTITYPTDTAIQPPPAAQIIKIG